VPDVRAAIVGSGPLMEDLQNYANRLGLADNIKFFGKRDDVEAILMRSKVFVMTSKSEGLSIAMAEAMSVGTVPVVADVGELRDLVIDGVTGYLVQPNRIDVYTDRTIALLQDPALWRKCSVEATEAARRHCDVAVVSKKWEQSLRNVISRASGLDHQEEKH
jgi:glycosyltransferase involved in cell wall biosynthesis